MWTLIKREIEDMIPLYVGYLLITVGVIVFFIPTAITMLGNGPFNFGYRPLIILLMISMGLLPIYSGAAGALQVSAQFSNKIPTFLCTLATTRSRIMIATLVAGILPFVIALAAMAITWITLLSFFPRLVPIDTTYLILAMIIAILINLACYVMGIVMCWTDKRIVAALAGVLLGAVLIGLVVIKGIGVESYGFLLCVITAGLLRIWQLYATKTL